MRKPHFCLSLFLAALAAPALAGSHVDQSQLRIGLVHSFARSTNLVFSSDHAFTLKDAVSGQVVARGLPKTIFKVKPGEKGLLLARADILKDVELPNKSAALLVSPEANGFVQVARLDAPSRKLGLPWHRYRGTLTVRREPDNTLRVVDTVPLEAYLYGVIPAEIGSDVPLEAMKAQAVAARTYALKNRRKCAADGYDLDDTTHCEGYFGVDGETAPSNAAVDDTRGQVLTYAGALIDAPYSTDSGGMTACEAGCPYLQAVRDAPGPNEPDYASGGKYHTWTETFSKAQLQSLLARDPRTRLPAFASLSLDGTDASGRITTATVWGTNGAMKTVTGSQLRQILGYDVLRSTRVTLTVLPDGSYRFDGRGWGHGLGMSQDGAVSMASAPYHKSYKDILSHYYVGTKIAPIAAMLTLTAARRGF